MQLDFIHLFMHLLNYYFLLAYWTCFNRSNKDGDLNLLKLQLKRLTVQS